jgi:hypothetical protein
MGRQGEIFAGFFTASGRVPGGETAVAKARRKKKQFGINRYRPLGFLPWVGRVLLVNGVTRD